MADLLPWKIIKYLHLLSPGREDLAKQRSRSSRLQQQIQPSKELSSSMKAGKEEEDGMEYMDQELLKLRFSDDLRVHEVRAC